MTMSVIVYGLEGGGVKAGRLLDLRRLPWIGIVHLTGGVMALTGAYGLGAQKTTSKPAEIGFRVDAAAEASVHRTTSASGLVRDPVVPLRLGRAGHPNGLRGELFVLRLRLLMRRIVW